MAKVGPAPEAAIFLPNRRASRGEVGSAARSGLARSPSLAGAWLLTAGGDDASLSGYVFFRTAGGAGMRRLSQWGRVLALLGPVRPARTDGPGLAEASEQAMADPQHGPGSGSAAITASLCTAERSRARRCTSSAEWERSMRRSRQCSG